MTHKCHLNRLLLWLHGMGGCTGCFRGLWPNVVYATGLFCLMEAARLVTACLRQKCTGLSNWTKRTVSATSTNESCRILLVKRAQGESVDGRGKLAQEKIRKITNYYGYALQSSSNDVSRMKKAVEANLLYDFHRWFFEPHQVPRGHKFNRALASDELPPPQNSGLPAFAQVALGPVFTTLYDERLLAHCNEGKSQNASESLHLKEWERFGQKCELGCRWSYLQLSKEGKQQFNCCKSWLSYWSLSCPPKHRKSRCACSR